MYVFLKNSETNIDVIEWNIKKGGKVKTSEDEVLKQAFYGLKEVNESLGGFLRVF